MTEVIHYSLLRIGETNAAETAGSTLNGMLEILKIIRPWLANRHVPLLLHDNARPHTSYRAIAKLKTLKYEVLQHLAYSLDLSPTDFFLNTCICFYGLNSMKMESMENSISEFINSRDQIFLNEENGAYFN